MSHYAVADSSKYTFPIMVKELCALGSGDSQCFAPITWCVYCCKHLQFMSEFTAHKIDISGFITKTPYEYNSSCYVHFTVPLYAICRCLNNTSQSYVNVTYVASIIQYPLQIHTFSFNALGSFNISRLCICARCTDVVHIILRIRTVCFIKHYKFRLILQSEN